MTTVHKKSEEKPVEIKSEDVAPSVEPEKVSVVPDLTDESADIPSTDPLNEFKEKMIREEFSVSSNSSKKNYMWPILFIFILALVVLVGIFVYKQGIFKGEKAVVETSAPVPTATPEPTTAPDLTEFEIEIQNGSGTSGEAGRQKTNLEEEGFTISSIGNADNSDYTDTIIQAKEGVNKAFLIKLKTILESSFAAVTEEVLSDDALTPVIVILGTKK